MSDNGLKIIPAGQLRAIMKPGTGLTTKRLQGGSYPMAEDNLSEFTGKHRKVLQVHISLIEINQVEHKTEGWMNQPRVEPREIQHVYEAFDQSEAVTRYGVLKSALLKRGGL